MKNRIKALLLPFLVVSSLVACNKNKENYKDIYILYTTDIHSTIDNGLSKISAYRNNLSNQNYVAMIDAGDSISGDFIGAISKGEYIIDTMNQVKYDFMTFGNHEFDYGMDVLKERVDQFKGEILSCNFTYIGKKENKFKDKIKGYEVKKYGTKKVGFVGVTTPYSITFSTPTYFMEDDEFAYSFNGETKEKFYETIQTNIDKCYKEKADYVVLISHLGSGEEYAPFSSDDVIKNTSGISIVLDGHAHEEIENKVVNDKDNKPVSIMDAGYKGSRMGQVKIAKDGTLSHELLYPLNLPDRDIEMETYIQGIEQKVEAIGNQVLASSDTTLRTSDEDGVRLVRNRETPIGNLIADAYKAVSGAQIAVVNGGGIRADMNKGPLTYMDLKAIHPFGNSLCVVEATGQQILDYLEFVNREVKKNYYTVEDGKKTALGELGAFASVSGLKFDIDTNTYSSVKLDDMGLFDGFKNDNRRVKHVKVLEGSNYVDIDAKKTYTFASHNYLLLSSGDGATMFKNCKVTRKEFMLDYEAVVSYVVDTLKGNIKAKYSATEGRINIL